MSFIYRQITLIENKEIRSALCDIYGVGSSKSLLICAKIGLSFPFFINQLNLYNFYLVSLVLNVYSWLDVRIKHLIHLNILKKIDINSYIGFCHSNKMPCRGQRTRTNAKISKKRIFIIT